MLNRLISFGRFFGVVLALVAAVPSFQSQVLAASSALLVNPSSLVFNGGVGGPFSSTPGYLTLTNTSTNQLSWTLINTSALFSVSATNGTLDHGAGTQILVSAGAPASSLPAGLYAAVVKFTNTASSIVQTGSLILNVTLPGIADDFEPAVDLSQWSVFGGSAVATNYGGWVSASNSLWFGGAGKRFATTVPIDASASGRIGFCLRLANGTSAPWGLVGLPSEGVTLEYTVNGGTSWIVISNYTTVDYFDWKGVALSIPAGAQATGTQFRWRQLNNSSSTADNWALDNVVVQTGSFAPLIIMGPQDQDVVGNDQATFSVAAVGSPSPTYQWLLNGTNISGATSNTLVISSVQLSDAGIYSVFISNSVSTVLSADAVLSYQLPPVCFPSPTNLVGWWRAETNATDDSGFPPGSLQGAAGYSRGKVGQAFSLSGAGSVMAPSSSSLQLSGQVTIEAWIKPSLISGDRSIVSKVGGAGGNNGYQFFVHNNQLSGCFNTLGHSWPEVTVISGGVLSAGQWYHVAWTYDQSAMILYCNGAAVATNVIGSRTITASSSNLQIGNDDSGNSPFYGLIDEASVYSRALSPAEIASIYAAGNAGKCQEANPPAILNQPESQPVPVAGTVSFNVSAGGTPPLGYQWRLNGTPILTATTMVLTITNAQPSDAGTYDVVVTNLFGSITSTGAVLTVVTDGNCVAPTANLVTWWAAEGNALDVNGTNNGSLQSGAGYAPGEVGQAFSFNSGGSVLVGDSPNLRFSGPLTIEAWINPATIKGDGSIVSKVGGTGGNAGYQFFAHGSQLAAQFNHSGGSWPAFVIYSPALLAPGQWFHVAWTYDQTSLKLYCNGLPVATNVIGSWVIVPSSSNLRIGNDDSGNSPFNGLIDEASVYGRALTPSEILAIYAAGSGGKCRGAVPPAIATPPESQSVAAGGSVRFNVSASGTPPLGYQWRFNGGNIAAATSAVLTLTNVQPASAGTYDVVVSSPYGSTNSAGAVLTVLTNGACVAQPANLVSWWAAEGNISDSKSINDGTPQGAVSYSAGEVGQGFAFNGSGGSVRVPDAANLRLDSQVTIEAWINVTTVAGDRSIASKVGGAGGNNGYQLCVHNNQLAGQFNRPGSSWPDLVIFSPGLIVPGQWFHVAWTYDQLSMKLYCNGVPVATNVIGAKVIAASSSNFRIGNDDSGNSPFNGLIDEASIYSRALTAAEVAAIYAAGSAGKCHNTGLPPGITTQPHNQAIATGTNTTFTVVASGSGPFTYQWHFNGTNISAATESVLPISNVQPADAGTYDVLISNAYGSTNSAGALLTVMTNGACLPPPANLSGWWSGENNAFDSAGGNDGTLLGSAAYALGEVGQSFAFDGSGSVRVPNAGNLRLTNQFTIEAWIKAAGVIGDRSIVSKVGGAGGNNGYQFILHDNQLGALINSPGQNWPGYTVFSDGLIATGQWYHVAWTYDQSALKIYCNGIPVATNVIGAKLIATSSSNLRIGDDDSGNTPFNGLIDEASVYSRALTAAEIAGIYSAGGGGKCHGAGVAPAITAQPQSLTLIAGSNVTFAVTATGTSPLSYQWRFNGTNVLNATNATLALTNVQTINAGIYVVTVSNPGGSTNSAGAVLTVVVRPQIVSQPQGQTVTLGSDALFAVTATGTVPLAYQWRFNGTNLATATGSSLSFNVNSSSQAGNYSVIVSNAAGAATSGNALLLITGSNGCVVPSANLASWWAGENDTFDGVGTNHGTLQGGAAFALGEVGQAFSFNGSSASVRVPDAASLRFASQITIEAWIKLAGVSGDRSILSKVGGVGGNNGYQFIVHDNQLGALINTSGQGWPGYTIFSAGLITTGQWYHVAWTYDQSAMKLYCNGMPVATNVIGSRVIATSGSNLQIGNDDTGNTPFNGQIDEASVYGRALSAAEIASIFNAGIGGKCHNPGLAPTITVQPPSRSITAGSNTTFTVAATGTAPLSYQWRFNGTNVNNATNATLALVNVQTSNAGTYVVTVTNAYGSTNSADTVLTVVVRPQIVSQPQGQTVVLGSDALFTVTATGTVPLSYQWRFNGANVSAATTSALALNVTSFSQAGNYSVTVSNAAGSVTSSNALLVVTGTGECVAPPADLVSWWPAEYDSSDSAGNNHGTLQGTTTFAVGEVDQAFSFDGSGASLLVADSSSLRLETNVTIEAWIKPAGLLVGDRTIVAKVGGAGGNNGYQFFVHNNRISGCFNSPGHSWPEVTILSGAVLSSGQWCHVAWTYDQSAMKLYCNGVLVAANLIGAKTIATSSSNLRIGNDDTGNSPFNGLIDEAAVYSRALSATEIAAIYAAGSSGKCEAAARAVARPATLKCSLDNFVLSFATKNGVEYLIEYKDNFTDANWNPLRTVTGTGDYYQFTDGGRTNASRFYRVRLK